MGQELKKVVRRLRNFDPRKQSTRSWRLTPFEALEQRTLLTVVWGDELGFDLLGENEAIARQLVQRSLDDWSKVIVDFNYDRDDNPDTNNTLVVNIGIFPFLGETRGVAFVTEIDENGLPTSADIFLDDDGASEGWYFDPTPGDDNEFRDGFVDPFRAIIPGQGTNDFYRTILHELVHAVGIESSADLAIAKYFKPAGKDQVDGTSDLRVFNNPQGRFGSQGFQATITTQGGVHIYEGPADPAFPSVPIHPGDLLNPGRTVQPPPTTRQLITDVNVKILVDAYDYTVRLPSEIDTFYVVYDSINQRLFVRGEPGEADEFLIRRTADEIEIHVNSNVEKLPFADITDILVDGGKGADRLTVDFSGDGNPIPEGGIHFNGGDPTGNAGDTLLITGGTADSVVHTFQSTRDGRVEIDSSVITYSGIRPIVDHLAASDRKFVFGADPEEINLGDDANPADNVSRISRGAALETIDFVHPTGVLTIEAGPGEDTINLAPVDALSSFRLIVDTGDGTDTIAMQGGVLHASAADTDQVVLEAGESLRGEGEITGDLNAQSGSQIQVTGKLSVTNLFNDGNLILDPGSELIVGGLDNAGGRLVADPSSTVMATGVVATGGLGIEKQFGNLILSGAGVTVNGPLDVRGTVVLTDGATVRLNATLDAGGLRTDSGTLLDAGAIDLAFRGDLAFADNSFRGTGTVTLLRGGKLTSGNNTIHNLEINHSEVTTVNGPLNVGLGGLTQTSGTLSLEGDADFLGPVFVNRGSRLVNPTTAGNHRFVFRDQIDLQPESDFELMGPASEVSFAPGSSLVISAGAHVTLAGSELMPLALRSTSPGQSWRIEAAQPDDVHVRFVDLQDSDASASPEPLIAALSIDSGNNTNWFFVAATTAINLDPQGNLLINDIVEKPDTLTIGSDGANLVIEDVNNTIETNVGTQVSSHRVVIPQALITGGRIIVELDEGDDLLVVRPSSGDTIDAELFIDDVGEQDNDRVVVDLSQGGTVSGIHFNAGSGQNDSIQIIGDTAAQSVMEFAPGSVDFNGTPVQFDGTEAVFLSNVRTATYFAPVASNEITISRPTGDAIIVHGTVDGIPFTEFTFDDISKISHLFVQGDEGSEHLVIDHSSGLDPIPGTGITFHAAGEPAGGSDVLEILGGSFSRVVYDYDNAAEGTIDLSGRLIRFTGVEPIINSGSTSNLIFDLTAQADEAELVDKGDGILSLISANGTFESTTFPVPSTRITLFGRSGDDTIRIGDLSASGFQGEMRLLGEAGDDRFELAATHGVDINAQGGSGENFLNGFARGPLVFNGGSKIELFNFVINDVRDGSPAMKIADADTNVRLDTIVINGHDDSLVEIVNGVAGATPPMLNLSEANSTFSFEFGADGVAFVDNQTSPTSPVDLQLGAIEFDVARNVRRTVRLTSDDRTIVEVLTNGSTHGTVIDHGDGTISYTPDVDFTGTATFRYELSDGSTGNVQIDVVPENGPPVNTVPPAQTVDEDFPLVFSDANGNAVSTSDPDAGNDQVVVTLTATNGTLAATRVGPTVVDNNNSRSLMLIGRIDDINATLDGLTFTPDTDFDGVATVTVITDDLGNNGAGGPLIDSDTIDINVTGFNDSPVNSTPGEQTTDEETPLVFSSDGGNLISIHDVDAKGQDVELTLRVVHGSLTLSTIAGLTNVVGQGTETVLARGSVGELNLALSGLEYSPDLNFGGQDMLTLVTDDLGNSGQGGAKTDTDTVDILVRPINDPPINSVPGAQTTDEEESLIFSVANANRLAVSDADADAHDIEVTVSVNSGSLTLATNAGLATVSGDGTSVLTVTAPVSNINTALDGLIYTPQLHFDGIDTLTLRTNDLGHEGANGAMIDTDTVTISVNAINDAPAITVPGAETINEDVPLVFSGDGLNPIAISDVDAGGNDVEVALRVARGALTLATTDGLTSVTGDGTSSVRIVASVSTANSALDGLLYTPDPNFNGQDALAVDVSDLGNSGVGGVLTDTATVTITIISLNDGPIVTFGRDPVTVTQDVGPQTIVSFVTLSAGPQDEIDRGQAVVGAGITGNDNPGLFSVQPAIDAAAALTFTPAAEAFGKATITFTASDDGGTANGGEDTTVVTFDILVVSDNNPPTVSNLFPDVSVDEDSADTVIELGANGGNFFDDADGETLTISAVSLNPGLVSASVVGDQLVLDYQDDQNGSTTIEVHAADSETTTTSTFSVSVLPINDAPINTVPAGQMTDRDVPLEFSTSAGNAISIADVDVGIDSIEVILVATQGTMTVSAAEGSNVTGDGTSRVTINGPLPGVNAALNGLTYLPPADFRGNVTLSIETNDMGHTGSGGPLSDSDNVSIMVGDVDNTPLTADILDVSPDPRASAVDAITIQFNQQVTGFDLSDLSLTRSTDSTTSLLPAAATLTTTDNIEWTLGNLSVLTADSGIYLLTLAGSGSGIEALSGNPLPGDVAERWIHGAGDVNDDRQFNQLDLIVVLQAGKYLAAEPASWSEGDWNGDGRFNQLDIVVAQQTQPPHYLQGPFAAKSPSVEPQIQGALAPRPVGATIPDDDPGKQAATDAVFCELDCDGHAGWLKVDAEQMTHGAARRPIHKELATLP